VSNQSTPHHRAQRFMHSPSVRARHVRLGMLGTLASILLFAIGCGGGSGGGSSTDSAAAIATAPIDLPPGQTTAQMAWAPSAGEVTGYLVFQSHDEGNFDFNSQVAEPVVQITGEPGDSIRILVVALGAASSQSTASHPSPPVRFHAAVEAVSAAVPAAPAPSASTSTATSSTQAQTADSELISADAVGSGADSSDATDATDATDIDGIDEEVVLIDQALLEQLLRSDARFPMSEPSLDANRWIQSFVEAQVGAGVSLAGSGDLDGDALSELVWMDSSGQLFVSEGARVSTAEDLPSTFVEAIRLRQTERFLGLADFNGDGVGDWIVEDTATGDLWILDDESQDARFSHFAALNPDRRLVGHGDFDGDGQAELLWQQTDRSFRLGRQNGDLDLIEWIQSDEDSADAAHATSELLTVADLNGDGRDDLLFRGSDGFLELALALPDSSGLHFEWVQGPSTPTDGLELVATLDLDRDGTAEIAWWGDGALEIWELQSGL
jgi:hypothetical protein